MVQGQFKVFNQKVNRLLKLGKPKIAMGLKEPDEQIIKSLRKSKKYAGIVLVGPKAIKNIKGFKLVIDNNPEKKIITMFVENKIEGIIRGTIDDFKTYEFYQKITGEKYTIVPGLMEDTTGRQFFLSSTSNPEGWTKEERLNIALGIIEFVKAWGIKAKVAVFAGTRYNTYARKKNIKKGITGILNKTYEEAEWIVNNLTARGHNAKNWGIDLNPAVEDGYNIIVPVNGMVGNQIFRAILFCGGKILSCTRLGLSRLYEDNSRTEKDFEFHVKWLVALINNKKFNK